MAFDDVLDPDFEARWATWKKRGVAHERAVRRRFFIAVPILAVVVTVAYTLLRS